MKIRNALIFIALVAMLLLGSFGCSENEPASTTPSGVQPIVTAKPSTGDKVQILSQKMTIDDYSGVVRVNITVKNVSSYWIKIITATFKFYDANGVTLTSHSDSWSGPWTGEALLWPGEVVDLKSNAGMVKGVASFKIDTFDIDSSPPPDISNKVKVVESTITTACSCLISRRVQGTVQNFSTSTFSGVNIETRIFSADGRGIGSDSQVVGKIVPDERWAFNICSCLNVTEEPTGPITYRVMATKGYEY